MHLIVRHNLCIYWDSCEYIEPFLFNLFILQYSHGNFEENVYTFHYLYKKYTDQKAFITFNGADSCQL